jgi:glyoxylate/hydroxypyruvate reductase A
VLDSHRDAAAYRAQQARAVWQPRPGCLARDRRVGVLGLGVLGAAAARALAALHFDVAGWSRSPKAIPGVACYNGPAGLPALLGRSEILVCLLPLTPETEGILGAATFDALPRGAQIINAARGGHLVEADLLAALDDGRLGGAVLDVFATEPLPPDHPFWHHPTITVTPHVAGMTRAHSAATAIAANIRRIAAGQPPAPLVDRTRGY